MLHLLSVQTLSKMGFYFKRSTRECSVNSDLPIVLGQGLEEQGIKIAKPFCSSNLKSPIFPEAPTQQQVVAELFHTCIQNQKTGEQTALEAQVRLVIPSSSSSPTQLPSYPNFLVPLELRKGDLASDEESDAGFSVSPKAAPIPLRELQQFKSQAS